MFKSFYKEVEQICVNDLNYNTNALELLNPKLVNDFLSKKDLSLINKIGYVNLVKTSQDIIEDITKNYKQQEKSVELIVLESKMSNQESIQQTKEFEENQHEKIRSVLQVDVDKKYQQLKEFREGLFNLDKNRGETFKEKYKMPKYKFTDTMSRTEINNLNRDLTAIRIRNIGVKEFRWLTSRDERVRPTHRKLDNKVFSFDNMPIEWNDYNCRCTIIAEFED